MKTLNEEVERMILDQMVQMTAALAASGMYERELQHYKEQLAWVGNPTADQIREAEEHTEQAIVHAARGLVYEANQAADDKIKKLRELLSNV